MTLPTAAAERKAIPIFSGFLKYFPDAIAAVAELSRIGNEQHNPGQPLHWAREKSTDHADCAARHLLDSGTIDTDNVRHTTKLVWRALALLQTEIEKAQTKPKSMLDSIRQGAMDEVVGYLTTKPLGLPPGLRDLGAEMGMEPIKQTTTPETKFGFTVGEAVNRTSEPYGLRPGRVIGFKNGNVLVWWDHWQRVPALEDAYVESPEALRHGA